jgi:hypothetical protein
MQTHILLYANLGETIKVDAIVSAVLLKKINEKRKLEVMVNFWKRKTPLEDRVCTGLKKV